jgi:peptidoglycan hydrolase CwlO-like protein
VSKDLDELKEKLDQTRLEIERLKKELKSTKEYMRKQNDRIYFDLLSSPINKIIHDT